MNILLILLIILLVFGGIGLGPWWGYSHHLGYGYWPSGIIAAILIIIIFFALFGRP